MLVVFRVRSKMDVPVHGVIQWLGCAVCTQRTWVHPSPASAVPCFCGSGNCLFIFSKIGQYFSLFPFPGFLDSNSKSKVRFFWNLVEPRIRLDTLNASDSYGQAKAPQRSQRPRAKRKAPAPTGTDGKDRRGGSACAAKTRSVSCGLMSVDGRNYPKIGG